MLLEPDLVESRSRSDLPPPPPGKSRLERSKSNEDFSSFGVSAAAAGAEGARSKSMLDELAAGWLSGLPSRSRSKSGAGAAAWFVLVEPAISKSTSGLEGASAAAGNAAVLVAPP